MQDVASGGQSSSALPYSGQQSGSLLPQPQSTSHADALDVKVERQRQAAEAAMQLVGPSAKESLPLPVASSFDYLYLSAACVGSSHSENALVDKVPFPAHPAPYMRARPGGGGGGGGFWLAY